VGNPRAALEARRERWVSERGTPLDTLRRMVLVERRLARLFGEPRRPWLLEGGYAMEPRLGPRARTTRDLDLSSDLAPGVCGDARREVVLDTLRDVSETDVGGSPRPDEHAHQGPRGSTVPASCSPGGRERRARRRPRLQRSARAASSQRRIKYRPKASSRNRSTGTWRLRRSRPRARRTTSAVSAGRRGQGWTPHMSVSPS